MKSNSKHNIGILLAFFAFLLSGCSDFLEKEVLGSSTSDNFYNTTYKLQKALNATYDILQTDMYNDSEWIFGEACGDDVSSAEEGGSSQIGQLVNFKFNTSNEWILNRYQVNYKGISRANQVIANAHRVKLASKDYNAYKDVRETLAQAKVLRALFYFNLVKTYGGVPIRPEIENVNNLVVPRSTKEQVYAYIEKDLREAAIMLKGRYSDTEAGKISSAYALGLLMKVLMYQAEPGVPSAQWEEMVKIGEYFVDGNALTYGAVLKYNPTVEHWDSLRRRLWFKDRNATDPYELPTTNLPVISNLYALNYTSNFNEPMNYFETFAQKGEFCKGSIFEVVFKESADGTAGNLNEGTNVFNNLYYSACVASTSLLSLIDGDPRRTQVLIKHSEVTPDGERCNIGENRYACLKWYTLIKDRPQFAGDNAKNRRVMRFAEVVLMYAEALNECGFGERALAQLNKTKLEANKINTSATLYISGGYGFMRNQIWKERRLELCFEWDRFFDIVRQKTATTILHELGKTTIHGRGRYFIQGVNEIFPIPQNEIDITNNVVTQNKGY